MTTKMLQDGAASAALSECAAEIDAYLDEIDRGLAGKLSDADLLSELQELESQARSVQAAWHSLIAQLEQRGVAKQVAATSTSVLLQQLLRLSPHEARQRVDAAAVLGPRMSLDGQDLPPLLLLTAQAQRGGGLSADHARTIARDMDRIPTSVSIEKCLAAETHLIEAALQLRPHEVGQLGKRILAHLDPDGLLSSDEEHERRRLFALVPLSDGSYRANGYLTPAGGAQLLAALSPLSAPSPAEDATPDRRSPGQRMHDGLEQIAGFALRHKGILEGAGAAQLIITMTADQFESRAGYAETSFGQLISVESAFQLADEAHLSVVVRDAKSAILAEGRTKRLATWAQTLALIGRDKGCSFPGCDRPPEWTQRHHVVAWVDGGRTDVGNLTLVCGHHHRSFERSGWRCVMRDGLPWWIPPAWLDRHQEPRLNYRIRHG